MNRLILIFIGSVITFSTFAQVNGTISYQGYLTDDAGEPVNDGATHSFVFKFYDSGSSEVLSRTVTSEVDKGLFSVIIGGGTGDNSPLPTDIWNEDYTIGISVDGGTELTPRTPLTTVPYSFQAETANNVAGSNITGTISSTLLTGTIDNTLLDAELQDLADGELSGSLVGTGISATNVTTGTLPNGQLDDDLQDLADGSLTGSKVGTGISATNITTGSLSNTVLDADLQDLADGELSGSKIGPGIDGDNIDNASIASGKISGPILVPKGGTGASTLTGVVIGNGLTAFTAVASTGGSQYLRSNAGNTAYEFGAFTLADGSVSGGTGGIISDGTIANVDIHTSAAIAGTKISPNFGSQNVTTSGTLSTTGGLHVGATADPGTDNLDVDGFTQLGTSSISVNAGTISHPAIKVLLIEGTTASAENGLSTTTLTGMTDSKIISIQVLVDYNSGDYVHPNFTTQPGTEFEYYYQNGSLIIKNHATNSENILSAPFKATITYTE